MLFCHSQQHSNRCLALLINPLGMCSGRQHLWQRDCVHLIAVDEGHVAVAASERVQATLVELQLREVVLVSRSCTVGSPQLVSEHSHIICGCVYTAVAGCVWRIIYVSGPLRMQLFIYCQ